MQIDFDSLQRECDRLEVRWLLKRNPEDERYQLMIFSRDGKGVMGGYLYAQANKDLSRLLQHAMLVLEKIEREN